MMEGRYAGRLGFSCEPAMCAETAATLHLFTGHYLTSLSEQYWRPVKTRQGLRQSRAAENTGRLHGSDLNPMYKIQEASELVVYINH